jgi:CelD/BcsL family acetyltransferase involved in cellulose biosynthesis
MIRPLIAENNISPKKNKNLSIVIHNDFSDKSLVYHWQRIQEEAEVYPQMYYEWCETWWRYRASNRKLYIITVVEDENNIVGIAPLCLENKFGVRILRTFPIRFGDFYSFLIEKNHIQNEILSTIIRHIKTFDAWEFVQLSKINNRIQLFNLLNNKDFYKNILTRVHAVDISNITYEEYIKSLTKNLRKEYSKRLRRIQEIGSLNLEVVEDFNIFAEYHDTFRNIYKERWGDDNKKPPSDSYYSMEKNVVNNLSKKNKIILFVLKLSNDIVAYRWGISHKKIYFAWRVSYNPDYEKYSPGLLLIGQAIKALIERKYKLLNFGAGDYEWKRRWSTPAEESANYEFCMSGKSIRARIYFKYRTEWHEHLSAMYGKLLKISWFRIVNRQIRKPK